MNKYRVRWVFLLSAMLAGATLADSPPATPAPQEARIPFAKKNIWNWRVVDDRTVLIQDLGRKWYKATLLGPCINLTFAQRVGFDAGPTDTFDRFSAILVQGRRCPLVSLVGTAAPPKKSKTSKPNPASPGE